MALEWEDDFDLDGADARVHAATTEAVVAGMEVIRAVVTPEVPEQSGDLVGSGGVTGEGATATLTYSSVYARYQEFGIYYRHGVFGAPLTHTHGRSFFLTLGIIEGEEQAMEAVARVLGGAL